MKILHVITNLETGGAEMMLLKLVSAANKHSHTIVSLAGDGTVGPRLRAVGGDVQALGIRGALDFFLGAVRLSKIAAQLRPDLVQGWMYHGNLAATVAMALTSRSCPLSWSIRCTIDMNGSEKPLTKAVNFISARLSFWPTSIIYNSEAARVQHRTIGYRDAQALVIPNGFDIERFRPNEEFRQSFRRKLGVSDSEVLVGQVARLDPMKDQAAFLAAAAIAAERAPAIRFVLAGRDVPQLERVFPDAAKNVRALGTRLTLLDEQTDVRPLMTALDLFVLSSGWGEGFPNVLGEAMACGVPCISTDVGDAATIIREDELIVSPGSIGALAQLIDALAADASRRHSLGHAARQTIVERYSLDQVMRAYEREWSRACPSPELGTNACESRV